VCGDGGFMMNSQELETARRLGLNLVVLILNDGAYGMIRLKQAVDGFTDYGMTFSNPDFVKYAEAYGCRGHEVTAIEQFIPTLEAAFNEGGVHLVSVPIDSRRTSGCWWMSCGRRSPEPGKAGARPADPPGKCRPWSARRGPTKVGGYRAGVGAGRFWYAGQPAVPGAASPLTTRFPQIHERSYRYPPRRRKQVDRRAP